MGKPGTKWAENGDHKGYANEDNFETVDEGGVLAPANKKFRYDMQGDPHPEISGRFEEIPLLDSSDPLSVASLVPQKVRDALKLVPPKVWLTKFSILEQKTLPTDMENQMRLAFWDQYAIAQDQKRPVNMQYVYNISSRSYFFENILKSPWKTAYFFTPPQKYQYKMREMLDIAHKRMREVLTLPFVDKKGGINTKLISEMVKISILLENRVMGAVKQHVEVRTKSLNVNVNGSTTNKNYYDVEAEIRQVEKQLSDLRAGKALEEIETHEEIVDVAREISSGDAGSMWERGNTDASVAEEEDGISAREEEERASE